MKRILTALLLTLSILGYAQETYPVNGAKENPQTIYAFTNARIYIDYQTKLDNATLIVKNDEILAVGTEIRIPKEAIRVDLKGDFIYPSFIDLYTDYGVNVKNKVDSKRGPIMVSPKKGPYHWNIAIHPERNAISHFSIDKNKAEEWRKIGFGVVLSHSKDGIARGTGALISLQSANDNEVILKETASTHYSFSKGTSKQDSPNSQMGAIALLRQMYLDAEWYSSVAAKKETNLSFQALNDTKKLPAIFETKEKLEILRADKLGDEFYIPYIIKGSGDEYQRIEAIKKTNAKLIIPLNYPSSYDVEDPFDARIIQLEQMKHWEMAPYNPFYLEKSNIDFALTASDLKQKNDFLKNVRIAVKNGLSEEAALKALTYTPAQLLKIEKIGSLQKGKKANFIITSGNIFEEGSKIYENWIQGEKYEIEKRKKTDYYGEYLLSFRKKSFLLTLGEESNVLESKLIDKNTPEDSFSNQKIVITPKITKNLIQFSFAPSKSEKIFFSGWRVKNGFSGRINASDEVWTAQKTGDLKEKEKKKENSEVDNRKVGEVWYPFMAYGWSSLPKAEEIIIKNATVWTNEKEGILKTSVHIKNGKIINIGQNITSSTAQVIDAKGKHLTSGIIDEHSHIAISKGVNEGTQASSAEVRIGDVVNSEDINIYRQLAGGVTAAQLLHGSANPIGGQSALIKLKWGATPEEMKIKGTDGFIKFALGENVKQSNWGEHHTVRFPQTRMGVEAVYYDHFVRAKEYEKEWKMYNSLPRKEKAKTDMPRKDLEMEALVEILNSKRFISCHSYMQHEINMLMHVGDSMGFTINTFTHILEGYKVADKMKTHHAGASTFSDWWAYKYEVNDAIPYNAAIMTRMGVTTAINSDDAEMGRRLNQEAAKTIKYGGLTEEEAWKTVTLNPAKLLHLDDHMGSIKVGKDADLVLWSDNPLSVYAKVEKTFVDGVKYYDAEEQIALDKAVREERTRLIQKMIASKKQGKPTQKPSSKKKVLYHCDHIGE